MQTIRNIYTRYIHDVLIAVEAIRSNKAKSLLTGLGIMFGVGAVISMLAIGRGAQAEVLEQIKMIGANNIIITPNIEANNKSEQSNGSNQLNSSKGLGLNDIKAITEIIPSIKASSPVIEKKMHTLYNGKTNQYMLNGVSPAFFRALNVDLHKGHFFSKEHTVNASAVCVLGFDVYQFYFNNTNPIGSYIKCGREWLKVIGVIKKRNTSNGSPGSDIGATNNKIFIPAQSMLIRYDDKSKLNPEVMENMTRGGSAFFAGGMVIMSGSASANEQPSVSAKTSHQVDKIIVQIENTEKLESSASIIKRMLLRRHAQQEDFVITIPELLLKQQQKTNDIFNIVLGAIAGISLIVGGIGIMNIMLASVWERIREIGTRQAIGATQKDIIVQFLSESVLISITGGIIGILLGISLAYLIEFSAGIKTIITSFSVLIAFFVSVSVGIIFGYLPAKRAAQQNPVESLRH